MYFVTIDKGYGNVTTTECNTACEAAKACGISVVLGDNFMSPYLEIPYLYDKSELYSRIYPN